MVSDVFTLNSYCLSRVSYGYITCILSLSRIHVGLLGMYQEQWARALLVCTNATYTVYVADGDVLVMF